MYCPSCGKQISDNSSYCLYCGKPVGVSPASTPMQAVTEWEYKDITLNWPPGHMGWLRADLYPEPAARLNYWQNIQSEMMPQLQLMFDQGWQPVTEIGPSCIQLRHYKSLEGMSWFWVGMMVASTFGVGLLFLPFMGSWKFQMVGFHIRLRKPKLETDASSPESVTLDWVPSKQEFAERKQSTPASISTSAPTSKPAPTSTGGQSNPNRQRKIFIAVVVAVILLSCCCIALVGGYWLYQNGDRLFSTQSYLLPLLLSV